MLLVTFPPIEWSDVVSQYVEFLATFAAYGALGFRWLVLRSRAARPEMVAATEPSGRSMWDASELRAATVGTLGALVLVGLTVMETSSRAAEKHITFAAALAGPRGTMVPLVLSAVLFLALLLARARMGGAWAIALLAGIALALRSLLAGRLGPAATALHVVGGSLWLGTLFVMVLAGLPAAMRARPPTGGRGTLVLLLVSRFSPVALVSAALLACSGVVMAWIHLPKLADLWSTPYGVTLILKLCVVASVLSLGAWNWRRMTPRLSSDDSAHALRRTATSELMLAAVVLIVTAVLVTLPSPNETRARGAGEGAPPPQVGAPGAKPAGDSDEPGESDEARPGGRATGGRGRGGR
jgi:copper transport protein